MPEADAQIARNVAQIRARIADAAQRSGRPADAVTLIAVTKYVSQERVPPLLQAGLRDLGESRPQALWEKSAALPADISWHLVGHLQRNKVDRTLACASLVHSVDRLRLLQTMEDWAASRGQTVDALLEVNASGDQAKHGFTPAEMPQIIDALPQYPHVQIGGLMTMASLQGGLDAARRDFSQLRELRDKLQRLCPSGIRLTELSMGMSRDFEVGIEEGATMVRIGTALFASPDDRP